MESDIEGWSEDKLHRQKLGFIQKVRLTLSRMISQKVEFVDYATVMVHGAAYNRTEIYDILRVIRDLGMVDDEGRFSPEAAAEWLEATKK